MKERTKISIINNSKVDVLSFWQYLSSAMPRYDGVSRSYTDRIFLGELAFNVTIYVSKYKTCFTIDEHLPQPPTDKKG